MTRLIQLADLHFGVEDIPALDAAARLIPTLEPAAIIVCGDVTQRGKRSEFAACAQWLEQFSSPILAVPGNHDTPLLNVRHRLSRPFDRFRKYFGNTQPFLSAGAARVAGLNTSRGWQVRRNWAEGSVDLDDLAQAIDKVSEGDDDTVGVIVCHHPFRSPRSAPLRISTRRGGRAGVMMAASDAQLLLTGHVHTPSAELWREGGEGTSYLNFTSGTLSQRLRASPPAFNIIDISPAQIAAWAFEFNEGEFVSRSLGAWVPRTLEPMRSPPVFPLRREAGEQS